MFIYSRGSSIIHTDKCPYAKRIINKHYAYTLKKIPGIIRLCKHCSIIRKAYRKERDSIKQYLSNYGDVKCCFKNEQIVIQTFSEEFRIVVSKSASPLIVYHRNTRSKKNEKTALPGFHIQNWNFSSILSIIKKAIKHTDYVEKLRKDSPKTSVKFNNRAYFKKMAQKARKRRNMCICGEKLKKMKFTSIKYQQAKYSDCDDYSDIMEQYGVAINF